MRILLYISTLLLVAQAAWARAAVEEGVDESLVVCKNNRIVRTIRVNVDDDGGCKTVYTKSGVDRIVGNGKFKNSCVQFLNNIKTNLEGASWSCREVSNSKVIVSDTDQNKQ